MGDGFHDLLDGPNGIQITKWTDDAAEADFEPSGHLERQCPNTKLQLNFKAKEYYLITMNAGEECELLGVKIPKLDKPRISKIVDGKKLIAAEYESFRKQQYELLASEYRNEIAFAVERAKSAASTQRQGR